MRLSNCGGAPARKGDTSSSRILRYWCGIRTALSPSTASRFRALRISRPALLWAFSRDWCWPPRWPARPSALSLGGAATAVATRTGISETFIREVQEMMKPGTSALFLLTDELDMEVVLHKIRELGGTVLKTDVDLERARLIQSALAATGGQESLT